MERRVIVLAITLLVCMAFTTKSDWVDYSSGIRCCTDIAVEECEPGNPESNAACKDVCHYGGCGKGGQCEHRPLTFGHVCHCNC
ncbi:hypothetical protein IHE45_19G096100 [Dioscorea alata]|uniref:Uncharacterized protein n=1 Tax=Dioscorea alata TaxID=55571 RepID=A0ACB7U0A4_DIOAL|nr:hypothetical protein IHE45_19G096100 [Dioscorea alata]